MGAEVTAREFTRADRRLFRKKVRSCVDAMKQMLDGGDFRDAVDKPAPLLGMEIEFNLVTGDMRPAMSNREVLESIDDSAVFQTELGQFNVEMNVEPGPLTGDATFELEKKLRASLDVADARIHAHDAEMVMIGMLPTLQLEHLDREWITANPRYELLNEQIFAARGEDIELDVEGVALPGGDVEILRADTNSVVPEAACTSMQLHLRVRAGRIRSALECRAVSGRSAGGACCQFSFPGRQGTLARIAHSRSSNRQRTPELSSSRTKVCDRECGSVSGGSIRFSTCSRRIHGTSRRCSLMSRTPIRWKCSRRAGFRS